MNRPETELPAEPRRRLIETSAGSMTDAYGAAEWSLLVGIAFIWGSSFLWMEIGLDAFSPGLITLARIGLGAAALVLIPRARKPVAREDWPRIMLLGVVWTGVPLTLFPIAQQWIDSAVAGMINAGVPLTTAVWATVLLRKLPGRTQLIGLAVGFAGVVAISLPELEGASASALGAGLVLTAITLYGLAANLAVPLQQRYGALPVIMRSQLVAVVVALPYGLFGLSRSSFSWSSALSMLPLGILGTGLAFVGLATLVGRVGGPRGTIPVYFTPIIAIALGIVVRDEQVSLTAVIGTVLVVSGAWITSRREGPRAPAPAVSAGGGVTS